MRNHQYTKQVLQDPSAFTTTLTLLALDRLGTDMINWHPMTVRREIMDEFHVLPPRQNLDKIYAGMGLLASDDFYRRLPTFVQYCNILSGGQFNPARLDLADADECAWGITEAVLLSPPEDENEPFSDEIRYYVGGVVDNEGIRNPPDVRRIGKWDKPTYGDMSMQDPLMFQMQHEAQVEESDQIKKMLRDRLQMMMREIESLKLENGDTSNLLEKMRT